MSFCHLRTVFKGWRKFLAHCRVTLALGGCSTASLTLGGSARHPPRHGTRLVGCLRQSSVVVQGLRIHRKVLGNCVLRTATQPRGVRKHNFLSAWMLAPACQRWLGSGSIGFRFLPWSTGSRGCSGSFVLAFQFQLGMTRCLPSLLPGHRCCG